MILSVILRFAAGVITCVIAFLVAPLPERIKERKPFSGFQSNAAHVFSGITELALALILFVNGYDRFVGGFSLEVSRAVAAGGAPNGISEAQIGGLGVLGFLLYLLHPVALISFYMFFEGCVRAFAAGLAERSYGIGAFWAIYRIAIFARKKQREAILSKQLGPEEPDSLFEDKSSSAFVLISVEDKPWRERQVARYGDDFYVLCAKNFVQQDRYYRYRYTFKRMHPGEIIRGSIAIISSADRKAADPVYS
jgi:hypothetical protein